MFFLLVFLKCTNIQGFSKPVETLDINLLQIWRIGAVVEMCDLCCHIL